MSEHDINLLRIRGSGSSSRTSDNGGKSGGKSGGGGKKGGTGDENTLRSKARARLVEVISEGECVGLVNGAKSIFFDTTPLQNADGTFNFENVNWLQHVGLQDEGYFNGHDAVETPATVEIQVKSATGPVQRTIVDGNADALRVIVRLPALVRREPEDGTLFRTDLSYAIDVRPAGGSWTEALVNNIINEKAVSPTQIAHRVVLPMGGSPWDVRVRRITADSTSTDLQNDLYWESYIVLVEGKFIYPNTAAIALEVDAENMGQSIPARSYHWRGLIVQVPTNYDPITRTYAGIWDGTFKRAWTNNPAWVFYDLVVHDRYGMGEFVDASAVDRWALYAIAQNNDVMVPTGYKNSLGADIMEPRYTFNGTINTRDEAFFVLQAIATTWRGMGYWAVGQVFTTADRPEDPMKIVAPANVIGDFEYSGTSIKARHSVVVVTWNDPADHYRPATELVINDAMLAKFGWREKSLQLTGCTSRGLARRYGRWVLDTEQFETETVTYKASWDHADVRPGNIIGINDPFKQNARTGGRVRSQAGTTITLDAPFVTTPGNTYSLYLTMPDGELVSRPVLSVIGSEVIVASAYPAQAINDAMYSITGTDLKPMLYRVLVSAETEKNVFQITALFHDPDKYARIESGMVFDSKPRRPSAIAFPPTNLHVVESGYVLAGVTKTILTLGWSAPEDMLAIRYAVEVQSPTEGRISIGTVSETTVELRDITPGNYTFYVSSIGLAGIRSTPAEFTYTAVGPTGLAMPTISNVELLDRPGQVQFIGQDVHVVWHNNFASSIDPTSVGGAVSNAVSPHYKFNTVKVIDRPSGTVLRTQRVLGTAFNYTYDLNFSDAIAKGFTAARRDLRFQISVTDVYDRTSLDGIGEFVNTTPAVPTLSISVAGQQASISWPPVIDVDFRGTVLWISEIAGFDYTHTPPAFDGTGNSFSYFGFADTTYYVRIGSYDAFNKGDMIVSAEQSYVNDSLASIVDTALGDIGTIVTGEGPGTLQDIIERLNERIADVANASVDTAVVSHTRREEMVAETAAVRAYFLEQVSVVADDLDALTTYTTLLQATVTTNAGTAAAAITTEASARATADTAQASAITAAVSRIGASEAAIASEITTRANADSALSGTLTTVAATAAAGTAAGIWEMRAVSGPSGVSARIAAIVQVAVGATQYEAGWYVDILSGGATRFAIKANQFVLLQSTGTALITPFVVDAGVAYIETAMIRNLTAGNIVAYSITGDRIAANTITAEKLTVSQRPMLFWGLDITVNKNTNVISWSAGGVNYTNSAGVNDYRAIAADSISWGGWISLCWVEGATSLSGYNDTNGGWTYPNSNPGIVRVALYWGGSGLVVYNGATVIDGDRIRTGSILAAQIGAAQITADKISVTSLEALSATLGNVVVNGNLLVTGTITTPKISSNAVTISNGSSDGDLDIYYSTQRAATVALTCEGGVNYIEFSCKSSSLSSAFPKNWYRLYRDDALLVQKDFWVDDYEGERDVLIQFREVVGVGTYTYYVDIQNEGNTCRHSARFMRVLNLKR